MAKPNGAPRPSKVDRIIAAISSLSVPEADQLIREIVTVSSGWKEAEAGSSMLVNETSFAVHPRFADFVFSLNMRLTRTRDSLPAIQLTRRGRRTGYHMGRRGPDEANAVRDEKIWQDFMRGQSYQQLADKHKESPATIRSALKRYAGRHGHRWPVPLAARGRTNPLTSH